MSVQNTVSEIRPARRPGLHMLFARFLRRPDIPSSLSLSLSRSNMVKYRYRRLLAEVVMLGTVARSNLLTALNWWKGRL